MNGRTLTITLPEELADELEARVASGEAASVSAVVEDAVRSWSAERGTGGGYTVEELRALWVEGLASGEGREFTDVAIEEIVEEVLEEMERERLQQ